MKASALARIRRYISDYGLAETASRLIVAAGMKLFPQSSSRHIPPLYSDLFAAGRVYHAVGELLESEAAIAPGEPAASVLRAEFNGLLQELDGRRQTAALSHPEGWNLREGPAFLLYCLVRRRRPQHVLELGVANGTSTF